ncbi:MAG: DUF4358 domain-containing protein [Clostridia bacterium]|nr:DUF4358 domain-containing protein [Clostridia bacterium]
MKKAVCLALVLSFVLALASCGPAKSDYPADVSMYDLSRSMLEAMGSEENILYVSSSDDNAENLFSHISGLDYGLVSEFLLLYAEDGARSADEAAVIAVKDEKDAEEARQSLQDHVEERIRLYETYGPSEVPKLNDALIFTAGPYAVLVVCGDPAPVKQAFGDFMESARQ